MWRGMCIPQPAPRRGPGGNRGRVSEKLGRLIAAVTTSSLKRAVSPKHDSAKRVVLESEVLLVPLQITTSNLERVRRIKNRMVRLTTRVETVGWALEESLCDGLLKGDLLDVLVCQSRSHQQLLVVSKHELGALVRSL